MPSLRVVGTAALGLLAQQTLAQTSTTNTTSTVTTTSLFPACPDPTWTCESFGVDFQNGGTYFQNENSTDDFTFASQYDECQPVETYNILVNPHGNQLYCSNTTLTPDNTTQTSTCPVEKADLISGDYSVLIISNNGNCDPIAFQRDFVLSVGTQVTTTVTPLVVFTSTSTPIQIITTTSTDVIDFYLPTVTVSTTKSLKTPTITVVPKPTTSTTTTTLSTKTLTRYNLLVANKIVTKTAKCTITVASEADSTLTVVVTASTSSVFSPTSSAIPTSSGAASKRSMVDLEPLLGDKSSFLQARAARLDNAVRKRDIDQATITIIQTNISDYTISTSTVFAATETTTTTDVITTTSTVPAATDTLYINSVTTITASQVTVTKTRTIKMVTVWATATKYTTVKLTITTTPTAKAAACTASGGTMF